LASPFNYGIAETGTAPDAGIRQAKVVDSGNQAVALESHLQMHVALVQVEVVHLVPIIDATDGPAGSFGKQWRDQLRFAVPPIAISASPKHAIPKNLFQGYMVHVSNRVFSPRRDTFNVEVLSFTIIRVIEPSGDGTRCNKVNVYQKAVFSDRIPL
jgi:hypothetical protein